MRGARNELCVASVISVAQWLAYVIGRRLVQSRSMLPTIEWRPDAVVMVDQRKLPAEEVYVSCRTAAEVARAIKTMVIRGAPAIGVAAAMGLALGVKQSKATGTQKLAADFYKLCELMAATRPTAVNLFWAIERMKQSFAARRDGRRIGRAVEGPAGGRGVGDSRRGRRQLPRHRRSWRGGRARRGAHSHALQRRRAGDGRLRHRAGRDPRRRRGGQDGRGVCRRDAAVSAGRAADRVGTGARRHRHDGHHRKHGRAADARRANRPGRGRRRSHRRQRRHRQQDRHLHRGAGRARARHAVLRRGADLDDRSRHPRRPAHPDRGARRAARSRTSRPCGWRRKAPRSSTRRST